MSERDRKIIDYFLEHPESTIKKISEYLDIPKSTVQRILNKYGDIEISNSITIKQQLILNKKNGNSRGGKSYFQKYSPVKDLQGRFIGSQEDIGNVDKEKNKVQDIRIIVGYFSSNPQATLESISQELTKKYGSKYTVSYVYKCLNDSRLEELFGKLISDSIREQLNNNRYNFFFKFDKSIINIDALTKIGLDANTIAVLLYRFNGGEIKSCDAAAQHFDCSKTTISNIEDKALIMINNYFSGNYESDNIEKSYKI